MEIFNRKTQLIREQSFETRYEKRHWIFFDYFVKVSSKKIGDDLIIATEDNFDKIFISKNHSKLIELVPKSNE